MMFDFMMDNWETKGWLIDLNACYKIPAGIIIMLKIKLKLGRYVVPKYISTLFQRQVPAGLVPLDLSNHYIRYLITSFAISNVAWCGIRLDLDPMKVFYRKKLTTGHFKYDGKTH